MSTDGQQRDRYLEAVDALADGVFSTIAEQRGLDDALDRALSSLRAMERSVESAHAWIFRDPAVLGLSENVFEALEAGPDGRREWLHADLPSAISAVARYDVMAEVVVRMGQADDEDDGGEPIGPAEA